MKKYKKILIIISILICVFGFLFFIQFSLLLHDAKTQQIKSERQLDTFKAFRNIADTIQIIVEVKDETPPETLSDLIKWFNNHDNSCLKIAESRGFTIDKEKFLIYDCWNMPIKLLVKRPNEYTFLSFGPNRKDDGGYEDDIIYTFNPLFYTPLPPNYVPSFLKEFE